MVQKSTSTYSSYNKLSNSIFVMFSHFSFSIPNANFYFKIFNSEVCICDLDNDWRILKWNCADGLDFCVTFINCVKKCCGIMERSRPQLLTTTFINFTIMFVVHNFLKYLFPLYQFLYQWFPGWKSQNLSFIH